MFQNTILHADDNSSYLVEEHLDNDRNQMPFDTLEINLL